MDLSNISERVADFVSILRAQILILWYAPSTTATHQSTDILQHQTTAYVAFNG